MKVRSFSICSPKSHASKRARVGLDVCLHQAKPNDVPLIINAAHHVKPGGGPLSLLRVLVYCGTDS
jgi:hypothetical protein